MVTLSSNVIAKIKQNITNNNKRDTKKFGMKGTLTYEQFMNKIEEQGNKCYICLQEFKYDGGNWCNFFPSADRISNYYPHSNYNVAIACVFCNLRCFKRVNEKKCGLCDGLEHVYQGDIITKGELFKGLGNSDYRIRLYIDKLNNKSNRDDSDEDTMTKSNPPSEQPPSSSPQASP